MHVLLSQLADGFQRSGNLREDMTQFLAAHAALPTADHCLAVGAAARQLALRFCVDPDQAESAGWLHDISKVIPNAQRLQAAQALELEVLPEEAAHPMLLHQKLSVEIARTLFVVQDAAVLSAIGCHTTLKPDASLLDKVVFIADKVEWDGDGAAPYMRVVQAGLERSLDLGVFAYLDFIWQQRHSLRSVHPWLIAAHQQLSAVLSS